MRNKYPLTTQTSHLFIVIRKNVEIDINLIESYCKEYFKEWSFIEHKGDIEPITALVEGTHYHIVGNAKKVKTPLSTHLNDLIRFFKFDSANGIQIDKYDNYISAIQYLIHKNDLQKTQHNFNEIHSSIDINDLKLIVTSESEQTISFEYVYKICITSNNIVDVIRSLGIKTYSRYRYTIKDIFEEIHRKVKSFEI